MYGEESTAFQRQHESEHRQQRPPERGRQSQWQQSGAARGPEGQQYAAEPPRQQPTQQQYSTQQGMQGQQPTQGQRGVQGQQGMRGRQEMQGQPGMQGSRAQGQHVQGGTQQYGQQPGTQAGTAAGTRHGGQPAPQQAAPQQGKQAGTGMQQGGAGTRRAGAGQDAAGRGAGMQASGRATGMQAAGGFPRTGGAQLQSVTLEDVSRTEVVTVEPDETIANVASEMAAKDVGSVLVVEDDEPIGILTDRKIATTLGEMPDVADRTADELVSEGLVTGTPGMSVYDAVRKLREEGIRRLPIVDDEGKLEGIVTLDDVIVLIAGELGAASEVIEAQSPPR